MKRKLLLAAVIVASALGFNANAQTDVTSTYLANPSFELTAAETARTSNFSKAGALDASDIYGWTLTQSNPDNTYENVNITDNTTNNSAFGSTVDPAEGTYYFFNRRGWANVTNSLSTTTLSSLPKGSYIVSLYYKAAYNDDNGECSAPTVTITVRKGSDELASNTSIGGPKGAADTYFNISGWQPLAVKFDVTEAGTVDFVISYNLDGRHGRGDVIIDNVSLYDLGVVTVANSIDVTGLMKNPSFENNTFTGESDAASTASSGNINYPTGWTFMLKTSGWNNCVNVTDAPSHGAYARETWAGTITEFKVYQALNNLPGGRYTISATARTNDTSANNICTYGASNSVTSYSTAWDQSLMDSESWNTQSNWQTLTATFNVIKGNAAEVGLHSNYFMQFDNFHLNFLGENLSEIATALPSGNMAADTWYYFDIPATTDYDLTLTTLADIVYTTDGTVLVENAGTSVTTNFAGTAEIELTAGRYYVKSASAQTLTVTAHADTYEVGSATASITEGAYLQSLTTMTLTYAPTTTNGAAALSLGSGAVKLLSSTDEELATATLAIDENVVTATFGYELEAGKTYKISASAGVARYYVDSEEKAVSEAQVVNFNTPAVFDGTYYLKDASNKYLSRGNNYATRAIADDYGIPFYLTTDAAGISQFEFVDSRFHLFDAGDQTVYCDNNTYPYWRIAATTGGYHVVNANDRGSTDYKLLISGGNILSSNTDATVWTFEALSDHATQMQAVKDAQAAAAATAAGLTEVTTKAALKAIIEDTDNYAARSITITGGSGEAYQQNASSANASVPYAVFAEETVNDLTPGLYKLSVQAFHRITWNDETYNAAGAPGLVYVYANEAKTQLVSPFSYGNATAWDGTNDYHAANGLYYPNGVAGANNAFTAGNYVNDVYVYVADAGSGTGTLSFGIKNPTRLGNDGSRGSWTYFANFTLTYYTNTVDDTEAATLIASATAAEGEIMKADVKTALTAAKTAFDADRTIANYNTLSTAVTNANASIAAYANAKTVLDAMTEELANTNVYTASAYATNYADILAAYDARTLENSEATVMSVGSGWRSANSYDDVLLSAWTIGGEACSEYTKALYINTWSTEGNTDGSNFKTPFFEYWGDNAASLAATTLTATQTGLIANGAYKVSAWVRVRQTDSQTKVANAINLKVGTGGAVDVVSGTQIGSSPLYADEYNAYGYADADGKLTITFTVNAASNVSWLSFKNVKYTLIPDVAISEDADYTSISTLANVTLTRTLSAANWNTFVVPFAISNAELEDQFGAGVEVAEYSESAEGDESTVSFTKKATATVEANVPVLIKTPNVSGTSFAFGAKTIETSDAKVAGTDNFDFVGSYDASITLNDGDYFISADNLYKKAAGSGAVTLKGTRAYIKAKSAGAKILRFSIDDEGATGIDGVSVDNGISGEAIYNVAGQQVDENYKGIVIKGGKKYLQK